MPRIVSMPGCQVAADDIGHRRVPFAGHPLQPSVRPEDARGRLGGEVVLGREVAVEAPMREARPFHDVGHANPVVPALSKELARHFENLFAVRLGLFARDPHDCTSRKPA